jgi:hypothetical protein
MISFYNKSNKQMEFLSKFASPSALDETTNVRNATAIDEIEMNETYSEFTELLNKKNYNVIHKKI